MTDDERWEGLRNYLSAEITRLESVASMEDEETDEMAASAAAGAQKAHEATLTRMGDLEAGQ